LIQNLNIIINIKKEINGKQPEKNINKASIRHIVAFLENIKIQ
jgi:hypothetical protein